MTRTESSDPRRLRLVRISTVVLLAAIVFTGLSYRLYLARFHTEEGIAGMAPWWHYIVENAERLALGEGLTGTVYAPGQSWAAYLVSSAFYLDPAVLRVSFGLLDGLAIVFIYLLASELAGRAAGLCSALFYALWPEGASASVNILHDHSPQPLLLFAGFWLLFLWLRKRHWPLLALAGLLLGSVPLFRTDSVLVAPLAALGLLAPLISSKASWRSTISSLALFLAAALLPSLPWDLYLYSKSGRFTHIAAGDAGTAVFLRYGRNSGRAGTRHADSEVAFLSGVNQPFGYQWDDIQRMDVIGPFGRQVLFADPRGYLRILQRDSWSRLSTPAGHLLWWPSELARLEDVPTAIPLRSPEWPLVILTAMSRIQLLLASRVALLALAGGGLVAALWALGARVFPLAAAMLGWAAGLLMLIPESRYLMMPLCLAFVLMPMVIALPIRAIWRWYDSAGFRPDSLLRLLRRRASP